MARVDSIQLGLDTPAPPPVALQASDDLSAGLISVTWIAHTGVNPQGYLLQRSLAGPAGPYEQIASTLSGVLNYTDVDSAGNPLPADTPVYYRARTVVEGRPEGGPPGPVDAGTRHLGNVEALSASDGDQGDIVLLTWTPVAGADGFLLEYKLAEEPDAAYAELARIEASSTHFHHAAANPPGQGSAVDVVYSYRIKATWRDEVSAEYSPPDTGFRSTD
jgi:hypothetical protein